MDKLVTSSKMTLEWLTRIKSEVLDAKPFLRYQESKYWATFRSPETERNICHLQPQKNKIRLFTRLDANADSELLETPSTGNWGRQYPSLFLVRSEQATSKAIELVLRSYECDLTL